VLFLKFRKLIGLYEVRNPKLGNNCLSVLDNKSNVEFQMAYHLKDEKCITFEEKLEKTLFNLMDNATGFHEKEKKNLIIMVKKMIPIMKFKFQMIVPYYPKK
jgi:hypothetical protein